MEDCSYKIVFLGESGVGAKTSLISRLINNKFYECFESTIGANYSSIIIQVNLGIIVLDLWDTPGQELYRSLCNNFIKGSHCIILGYDISRARSLYDIKEYWYNKAKNIVGDDSLIYLVANKIDLIENINESEKEGINYAKEKDIKYFKVSCKTGEGVNELFEDIANSLIMKFKRKIIDINDKTLIKYLGVFRTEVKRLNIEKEKEIVKNETEIKSLDIKENIEIILNKYYNY